MKSLKSILQEVSKTVNEENDDHRFDDKKLN